MKSLTPSILALTLSACAPSVIYPPEFTAPVERGRYTTCVQIELLPRDEAIRANTWGLDPLPSDRSAPVAKIHYDTEPHPLIRAPLLTSPNDEEALKHLGHEMYHLLFRSWHGEPRIE